MMKDDIKTNQEINSICLVSPKINVLIIIKKRKYKRGYQKWEMGVSVIRSLSWV
jgi:hypothetical protein